MMNENETKAEWWQTFFYGPWQDVQLSGYPEEQIYVAYEGCPAVTDVGDSTKAERSPGRNGQPYFPFVVRKDIVNNRFVGLRCRILRCEEFLDPLIPAARLDGSVNYIIDGGAGNDILDASGSQSDVTLLGGIGNDKLYGEAGDDTLAGNGQDDSLEGGSGKDSLIGGAGADTLRGNADNDTLDARDGAIDSVDGGSGADSGRLDSSDTKLSIETLWKIGLRRRPLTDSGSRKARNSLRR